MGLQSSASSLIRQIPFKASFQFILALFRIRITKTHSGFWARIQAPYNNEMASTFPFIGLEKSIPLPGRVFALFFNIFFLGLFKAASISSFPTRLRELIPNFFLNHRSHPQKNYFKKGLGFPTPSGGEGDLCISTTGTVILTWFDGDGANPG